MRWTKVSDGIETRVDVMVDNEDKSRGASRLKHIPQPTSNHHRGHVYQ